MWQSLHDAWWRLATQSRPRSFSDALACRALSTGSLAYRLAVAARNTAYDRRWLRQVRLPCRVVSVGNVTVGGTGKTTCVELVAKKLAARGARVAVLSRGYGGVRRDYWLRAHGTSLTVDGQPQTASDDGLADEPQLLARHLAGVPVLVGPERARTGARACVEFGAEVVILDDGFQHRRVVRDCDIVLIHARMPLDGWALLPRGPMREPLRALSRADVVIITKADEALERLGALSERLRALNPRAVIVTAAHAPARLLDTIRGTVMEPQRLSGLRIGLLSSIGDPEGFEATVQRLHATVLWHRTFPDHHRYRATDWSSIIDRARGLRPDAIVTTEKDWVRLEPLVRTHPPTDVPVWVLGVEMRVVEGATQLNDRLARVLPR